MQQRAAAVSPAAPVVSPASVSITPASVDAKVKRGATYTQTYTLFNHTPERLRFRCSVIEYWYDKENRRVTGRPGTLPRSASTWVQFTPAEVFVEPGSSATVKAVVTLTYERAGMEPATLVYEIPFDVGRQQNPPAVADK